MIQQSLDTFDQTFSATFRDVLKFGTIEEAQIVRVGYFQDDSFRYVGEMDDQGILQGRGIKISKNK